MQERVSAGTGGVFPGACSSCAARTSLRCHASPSPLSHARSAANGDGEYYITEEFIEQMIAAFKEGKNLHRRYVLWVSVPPRWPAWDHFFDSTAASARGPPGNPQSF